MGTMNDDDDDDDGGDGDDDDDDGGALYLRAHHQIRHWATYLQPTRVQNRNTKRCSKSLRWMKGLGLIWL